MRRIRLTVLLLFLAATASAAELSVADFSFEGTLGSAGATIARVDTNHFRVTLGHAPEHPKWANKVQFQILRNAKGNALQLDVVFPGGNYYRFNEYFYSWSYDGAHWNPVHWQKDEKDSKKGDTLLFPVFAQDTVYVGHQVPMSYEELMALVKQWQTHPAVTVHTLGQSLGGRDIIRLEITDPNSPHPRNKRWVHYIANQHPGEHNAQWRMAGMLDWLLSDEGAGCRRRSIAHFILMMSPDAPSQGWYRVNAQGIDMNRSYRAEGSDAAKQAHEAYIVQRDLECIMASDAPVTDLWSMHTWSGDVEPILQPGPEIGTVLGPWTQWRDILERHDTFNQIKPIKVNKKKPTYTYWTHGPQKQFGITAMLCEGASTLYTKQENVNSGIAIMKSIAEYYRRTK